MLSMVLGVQELPWQPGGQWPVNGIGGFESKDREEAGQLLCPSTPAPGSWLQQVAVLDGVDGQQVGSEQIPLAGLTVPRDGVSLGSQAFLPSSSTGPCRFPGGEQAGCHKDPEF